MQGFRIQDVGPGKVKLNLGETTLVVSVESLLQTLMLSAFFRNEMENTFRRIVAEALTENGHAG